MEQTCHFQFLLGSHRVAIEGVGASYFAHSEAFAPFADNDGDAEWRVCYGRQVEAPPPDAVLLSSFDLEYEGCRCLFHRSGDNYYYSMFSAYGRGLLLLMRFRRGGNMVESTSVGDPGVLHLSLWFAVSMLSASLQVTFVHSSTVVYGGRAVMFLGESGTGKRTHSRLWLDNIDGVHLLNDDSPVVTVRQVPPDAAGSLHDMRSTSGVSVYVYGSPWSGKTPCYVPRCYPLAAVVRLSQAPHNAISRLGTTRALVSLQPSLPPALAQDDYFSDQMFVILSAVISSVPVYHLECLPDADAARLCFKTVFQEYNASN